MRLFRPAAAGLAALLIALFACKNSEATPSECLARVNENSYQTPGPGQLSVGGTFYDSESILIKYNTGATDRVVSGEVNESRDRVTFSDLPSGSLGFVLLVSCDHGQFEITSGVVTIL